MSFFMSGVAAVLAGIVVVLVWNARRKKLGLVRKKSDYIWAFMDGGVAYVMGALLIVHNCSGEPYSEILAHGFGEPQVNIAFIGSMFEAMWALWDLWNGNGMNPIPEA